MTQIRGLGYLRVQTRHIDRWREFALDGLGFAEGSGPDPDGLYLRMDERRSRLQLLPGDDDRVLAVGWEVRDQYALASVREAVEKAGTAVTALKPKEAAERDAEEVIAFTDPGGTPVEVFFGPVLDHSPCAPASRRSSSPAPWAWATSSCRPRTSPRPPRSTTRSSGSCRAAR